MSCPTISYRLFGVAVACDLPLTGVPEVSSAEADIRVARGPDRPGDCGHDWLHSWHDENGEPVLACARFTDAEGTASYLLRFPGLAEFAITGTVVLCHPQPDCGEDSLRHLLLDQVMPRLWAHLGHLVVHASAVQLQDDRVIAFLGKSGWGKSTLAAAMQSRGCRLLSDDSIWLRAVDGRVTLVPGYTGLRLNEDSITTLDLQQLGWASACHYSDKRRLALLPEQPDRPLLLDALYVLAEPGAACGALSISPAADADLVTSLIRHSFLLDVRDAGSAKDQLHQATAVVRAAPGCFTLAYPRGFPLLSGVCESLLSGGAP